MSNTNDDCVISILIVTSVIIKIIDIIDNYDDSNDNHGSIFKNGKDSGLALILLGSTSKLMMMTVVINFVVYNEDYILFCLPMVILKLMICDKTAMLMIILFMVKVLHGDANYDRGEDSDGFDGDDDVLFFWVDRAMINYLAISRIYSFSHLY